MYAYTHRSVSELVQNVDGLIDSLLNSFDEFSKQFFEYYAVTAAYQLE